MGSLSPTRPRGLMDLLSFSGMLALFIGFTCGMALDRFETRRARAVSEAKAVGMAGMRV